MAITEAEKANCSHRVKQQDSVSIDLGSRSRFIHCKGTFEHRLFEVLKNHIGKILVSIAKHSALVIDDTCYPQTVRINDDVVKTEVGVHQRRMINLDGGPSFECQIYPLKQTRILDDLG